MLGSWGGTRRYAGALAPGIVVLVLATASIALSACGGGDDDGGNEASVAELSSSLPTGGDLGLDERGESDWEDATDLLARDLVIGGATDRRELGSAIEDAGFQGAAGRDLGGPDLNVRIRAVQFDSEEGALEARDLLHEEDLKSPCVDACVVTPLEYELDDVPDSAAVHHVPLRGDAAPGEVQDRGPSRRVRFADEAADAGRAASPGVAGRRRAGTAGRTRCARPSARRRHLRPRRAGDRRADALSAADRRSGTSAWPRWWRRRTAARRAARSSACRSRSPAGSASAAAAG